MMSHLWDDDGVTSADEPGDFGRCVSEISMQVFLTGHCSPKGTESTAPVTNRRPDVATEISRAVVGEDPREVLVFVCGPAGLVKCTRDVAVSLGFTFYEEKYL
ncbi:hypothetical protein LSM04_005630 [Trypanosoma melophagium]|nr:hypothetical protein LSM04_005630 [Trypanosoma melophagium]